MLGRVALAHQAINLSQGFPDFDPPEALIQAAERAARWALKEGMTSTLERLDELLLTLAVPGALA